MLTAMYAVENLVLGAGHDLWAVNLDDDYHEESSSGGTGRDAPVTLPQPASPNGNGAANRARATAGRPG
jgi:hypothetical protein